MKIKKEMKKFWKVIDKLNENEIKFPENFFFFGALIGFALMIDLVYYILTGFKYLAGYILIFMGVTLYGRFIFKNWRRFKIVDG